MITLMLRFVDISVISLLCFIVHAAVYVQILHALSISDVKLPLCHCSCNFILNS